MAQVMAQVLDLAGDAARHVRGFVTNVSNYGTVSAEAGYANTLRASLASLGHSNLAFVVDTGRNAGSQMGGTWCNPKGAGMGPPPTSNPGVAFADAFFWIKPPGESDGISTPGSPRFDPKCGQQGVSWSGAPEAGEWFGESFTELVQKAKPPLASAPTYTRHFVLQPNPPPNPPRPSGLRQPTRAEEPAKQRARTRPELELDAHGEPPPTAAAAQENDSEVLRQARIAVALIKETQLQQARENERRQPPSPPAVCTTPAPSTGNCTSSSVEVDPEGIGGLSASQLAAAGW